jgi:hypothetical protein
VQIWDSTGAEISSRICRILGGEGGFADVPKPWPVEGLLTDVAYRWDVVRTYVPRPVHYMLLGLAAHFSPRHISLCS